MQMDEMVIIGIDGSPRHNLGGLMANSMDAIGQVRRPVTSGDIQRMLASA